MFFTETYCTKTVYSNQLTRHGFSVSVIYERSAVSLYTARYNVRKIQKNKINNTGGLTYTTSKGITL